MRFNRLAGLLLATLTAPAWAQDDTAPPPAIKVTGGVTAITDYRFRGLTQTDEHPAIQGTVNVNHESGFYIGTWASSIDGGNDGSTPALTGYGGAEVDLYGGFTKGFGGATVDAGLLYYYYPGGRGGLDTDFFEPYASLGYTIGPVAAKAGFAYAWAGQRGLNFTSGSDDNLYVYGEASVGIPTTPITLKGHLGFTNGALGLVNPTIADDSYTDWSATAEYVRGPFKAGVSYVDTDIANRTVPLIGHFAQRLGRGATVLGYVGVSF